MTGVYMYRTSGWEVLYPKIKIYISTPRQYTDARSAQLQRKILKDFFLLLVIFNVDTTDVTINIQDDIWLLSTCLKHVVGCRSHACPYPRFQLLIVVFDLPDEVIHITAYEKNPLWLSLVT
jgi:hypothetical protein